MSNILSSLRCYVDRSSSHGPYRQEGNDAIDTLHALLRAEKHHHLKSKSGLGDSRLPFGRIAQRIAWFHISLVEACLQFFRPERKARRRIWHFFVDVPRMIHIALRYNLSAVHYYVYEFHRRPLDGEEIRRYLTGWESHYLSRRIARLRGSDVGLLDHKDSFATFCAQHNLPTLPILDLGDPEGRSRIQRRDLFAKGTLTYGGAGCHLIAYRPETERWRFEETDHTLESLHRALLNHYSGAPFIVQYRARNHSEIDWLSDRVLTTIRAITAWDPQGNPVILRTAIRIPKDAAAFLDNSNQGGLAAPVDPVTGVITGPAIDWFTVEERDTPVGSDRSFLGFKLPQWDEVVATLKRAHIATENYNFLGWDVAITTEGVILNECNVWSDIELVQVPHKTPFLTDDVMACFEAEKSLWVDV